MPTELQGVAPPGWEPSVKKMKRDKGIDNPWALAWYMKRRGYKPARHENDAAFDHDLAAAMQEIAQHGLPRECRAAAQGNAWGVGACLDAHAGAYVHERRWR